MTTIAKSAGATPVLLTVRSRPHERYVRRHAGGNMEMRCCRNSMPKARCLPRPPAEGFAMVVVTDDDVEDSQHGDEVAKNV